MKKTIPIFTAALLTIGLSTTAFAADITVTVEDIPVTWTDAKPFIDENSRTLVPLRPIANALGLTVTWNDDTNTAAFTDEETTVEFTVGSEKYHAFLNGYDMHVYLEMDTKPVIKDSRIYAPARYLAESFSYNVGWIQATQTVTIEKTGEDPGVEVKEDVLVLPEVPAGKFAAISPVTTEAGATQATNVAFAGVTLVDDPDIFEYSIDFETPLNGIGFGYGFVPEKGFMELEMSPEFSTTPGTYPVTLTIPKEFFSDAKEDIIVSTTLTVTAATPNTLLERVLDNLDYGLWVSPDCHPDDVINAILEEADWFVEDTPFVLTVTDGSFIYDAEGSLDMFRCTLTVTNTETGLAVSLKDAEISLYLASE